MNKLNNKGFAISALIYSILIMGLLIMSLLYSTIAFRKKATSDFTHNVEKDLTKREVLSYTVCTAAKTLHKVGGVEIGTKPSGNTLKPGDAFDCNVAVINNYVEDTYVGYRFYYLSREDGNNSSQNAVLIYYQNTPTGSDNATIAYDTQKKDSTKVTPTGLMEQFPTIDYWKNTSLINPGDEEHKSTINGLDFYYKNNAGNIIAVRAPRLSEIKSAAGEGKTYSETKTGTTGNLSETKLSFLSERTKGTHAAAAKGYWLETVSSTSTNKAWVYDGEYKGLYTVVANDNENKENKFATRPVIVVDINNLYWE